MANFPALFTPISLVFPPQQPQTFPTDVTVRETELDVAAAVLDKGGADDGQFPVPQQTGFLSAVMSSVFIHILINKASRRCAIPENDVADLNVGANPVREGNLFRPKKKL